MSRAQTLAVILVVGMISTAAGVAIGKRTAPERIEAARPKESAAPAKNEPVVDRPGEAAPVADAGAPAKTPATTAPKPAARGSAGLPAALAKTLKLTPEQQTAVAGILKDWQTRIAEANKKIQEALKSAKAGDPQTSIAMDQWRQEFTALKNDRTGKLMQALTPEQGAQYREYRDKQYQGWLDQQATQFTTLGQYTLGLSKEQLQQIKPMVRSAVDEATAGGTMVPATSYRDNVMAVLKSRIQPLLTPDQAKKFQENEASFTFDYR